MESFLDFERQAEVKDGGTSIVVFEQWMQTRDPALLAQIDEYNREDCIATRAVSLRRAGRTGRSRSSFVTLPGCSLLAE
jgi:predicted RecB family nuclease